MPRKSLMFVALLVGGVLALAAQSAAADDKKDDKDKPALSGVWMQTGGEVKIEFSDKDVLKISPHGKDDTILIVCKHTVEKDGLVKVTITEFDGKEEVKEKLKEKLGIGLEFSFKWKVKDGTATLDDIKGEKIEAFKSHLEGKYDKK